MTQNDDTHAANHAVAAGATADLVAIEAASIEEAVIGRAKRSLVMKRGVVVAENGRLVAG